MFSGKDFIRFLFFCISMTLIFIIPFLVAMFGRYYPNLFPIILIMGFISIIIGVVIALNKLR